VTKVLVIDDEEPILRALRINLTAHQYEVTTAADGRSGLAATASAHPDVLILDLGLPDMEGTEVITGIRGWSSVPIIVLSAWGQESAKIAALDAGADDYVTKPFSVAELMIRVAALLRRRRLDAVDRAPARLSVAGLEIDPLGRTVEAEGNEIRLTSAEFELLLLLAEAPGQVFTRTAIMEHLWRTPFFGDERAADTHIANIRRKLERDPAHPTRILTVRGVGYKLGPAPRS
jgi:two-component system, OmpR family, KDP operon response regulator KdpE